MKRKTKRKAVKISICLPVDDGARHDFWLSLMGLITRKDDFFSADDVGFEVQVNPGDSLITRSRNNLAHDFLHKTDCDYLLFLDTDLDFQPEDIKRLIDRRREDAVVCGQYAIKTAELRMCYNKLAGEAVSPDGLLKVAESGTGAMLIPRGILEAYRAKHKVLEYTDDQFKDKRISFFDVGVVQTGPEISRYLSEDWLFCRRIRQLGFSVYVDTGILLGHHGWIRFPLSDEFLISAIASRCIGTDIYEAKQILKSFRQDIDRATKARWKQIYKPDSRKQRSDCKPS
jgi:hypothetical protein